MVCLEGQCILLSSKLMLCCQRLHAIAIAGLTSPVSLLGCTAC